MSMISKGIIAGMGEDLSNWGRVTHICVSTIIIIDSYNALSPGRRQAIIWTNAGMLLIGLLGTKISDISEKNGGHLVSASMC